MSKRTKRAAADLRLEKADAGAARPHESGAVAGLTRDGDRRFPSLSLLPDNDWGPAPRDTDESKH